MKSGIRVVTYRDNKSKIMYSVAFASWMFWLYFVSFCMYCYYLILCNELSNLIDLLYVGYQLISSFFIYIMVTFGFVLYVLYKIIYSPSIASDGIYIYHGINMSPLIKMNKVTHIVILHDSKYISKKILLLTESNIPIKTSIVYNIDKFIDTVREEYYKEISHISESKQYSIFVEEWLLICINVILLISTLAFGIVIAQLYSNYII